MPVHKLCCPWVLLCLLSFDNTEAAELSRNGFLLFADCCNTQSSMGDLDGINKAILLQTCFLRTSILLTRAMIALELVQFIV